MKGGILFEKIIFDETWSDFIQSTWENSRAL